MQIIQRVEQGQQYGLKKIQPSEIQRQKAIADCQKDKSTLVHPVYEPISDPRRNGGLNEQNRHPKNLQRMHHEIHHLRPSENCRLCEEER